MALTPTPFERPGPFTAGRMGGSAIETALGLVVLPQLLAERQAARQLSCTVVDEDVVAAVPSTTVAPAVPVAPAAPSITVVPALPAASAAPTTTDVTAAPAAPAAPAVSDVPVVPAVPVVSAARQVSEMSGPASPVDLEVLAGIDPASLDAFERIEYLKRVEKVESLVAALKMQAIVAIAGETASTSSSDEAHAATEIALARRVGQGAAGSSIEVARAIVGTFPEFLEALRDGDISDWHCRELVTATRAVTDSEVLRLVGEKTLRKAKRMTPREFAGEVAKVIARHDRDLESRMVKAREDRRVWCTDLPNGMGFLGLVHDQKTIRSMFATITADGRTLQLERGGSAAVRAGDDDARADASRADAMAARMLGTVAEDGSVTWDRAAQEVISLTLVMDLDTLRAEADRFALLDGQPIPAGLARDLAEGATLWRRAVTDPVTGVLLDYGTEQYLPETLRRFVKARDGVCGTPICARTERLEMDHQLPFPQGPTSAGNCKAWCPTCHQLKTERRLHFTDTRPDGSATLITEWGQKFTIPPRPFLHDPADEPPSEDPPAEESPPPSTGDDTPPF